MKIGNHIFLFGLLCLLLSCEIEPFEGDSRTEGEGVDLPEELGESPEEESELTESEEDANEGIAFSTGILSFEINSRSFVNDQNNGLINGSMTTVVSVDKLTGERINITFTGNSTGLYMLNDLNEALYFPDFLQEAYSTAVNLGSGSIEVTRYDQINNQIEGFFEFTAYRERKDVLGNVVLDLEGNVVYERVDILKGGFEKIPLN